MFAGLLQMGAGAKGGGSHGAVVLLKQFVWDYWYAAIGGALFAGVALLLGCGAGWLARPGWRKIWIVVWAFGLMLLLLKWPAWSTWSIPAILYLVFLAAALDILECAPELRLLCVLAGIVLFVIPLGSGDGIHLSHYVMPLALPTALMVLMSSTQPGNRAARRTSSSPASNPDPHSPPGGSQFNRVALRLGTRLDLAAVAWAVMLCVVGFSVAHGAVWTHRDSPDRLAMLAAIDHPKLRGIFTTSSRARAIEELLRALQPLVRKDDYLFDHMQIPLVYFLTETRPYLSSELGQYL